MPGIPQRRTQRATGGARNIRRGSAGGGQMAPGPPMPGARGAQDGWVRVWTQLCHGLITDWSRSRMDHGVIMDGATGLVFR